MLQLEGRAFHTVLLSVKRTSEARFTFVPRYLQCKEEEKEKGVLYLHYSTYL